MSSFPLHRERSELVLQVKRKNEEETFLCEEVDTG